MLRQRYEEQRRTAKGRGIPFLLTYGEWLLVWQESGHLNERGRQRGQYVMARFGDAGPYSVGNVKIILHADNSREKVTSTETRERISASKRGMKPSPETRAKLSAARRRNGTSGMAGKRHSQETKERIARSMAKARAQRFWSSKVVKT